MFLKSIKISGFKSFANRVHVLFPGNLCCVVGPNGCGKSNIIDGIRWVLGESSAKQLRSNELTDVIFAGTQEHKPVSMASIELLFDNSTGSLRGKYAGYSEVAVRREISRDKQSRYYLNNQVCRRRDISDMLAGTGLGPYGYAVIEQGMVARLVEAKPDVLRSVIEEAAGVYTFKSRHQETETRIKRVLENLRRIKDMVAELDKQLAHLKKQAKDADRYIKIKEEERFAKGQLLALKRQQLNASLELLKASRDTAETRLKSVSARHYVGESQMEQQQSQRDGQATLINRLQGETLQDRAESARLEESLKLRWQQLQQNQQEMNNNIAKQDVVRIDLKRDQKLLENVQNSLSKLLESLKKAVVEDESKQRLRHDIEAKLLQTQQTWDEVTNSVGASQQEFEICNARLKQIRQNLLQTEVAKKNLHLELQSYHTDSFNATLSKLDLDFGAGSTEIRQLEEQILLCTNEYADKNKLVVEITANLHKECNLLATWNGQLASLRTLQEHALRPADAETNKLLATMGLKDHARLAEKIKIESGWELALETVLGDFLQAIVIDDLAPLAHQLEALQQGNICLLTGTPKTKVARGKIKKLLDLLVYPINVEPLLQDIYCVDNLEQALYEIDNLDGSESIICKNGVWLGRNWIRVQRGSNLVGVLLHEQQIEALGKTISGQQKEINRQQKNLEGLKNDCAMVEKKRTHLQVQLSLWQKKCAEWSAQQREIRTKIVALLENKLRNSREMQKNEEHIKNEQICLNETENLLQIADVARIKFAESRSQIAEKKIELQKKIIQVRIESDSKRNNRHALEISKQKLETELKATNQATRRLLDSQNELHEKNQKIKLMLAETQAPIDEIQEDLNKKRALHRNAERELMQETKKLKILDESLRTIKHERMTTTDNLQTLRQELEQFRSQQQIVMTQSEALHERLVDAGYNVDALEVDTSSTVEEWEVRIKKLEETIRKLGSVNLVAAAEYQNVLQRKQYIDEQHIDIVATLESLRLAIKKIDKQTKLQFQSTFNAVNASFQKLFPQVFGGGSASLRLIDNDVLTSGVAIMASPPGKLNIDIKQLSSGEKSLIAIALLFSVMNLNPDTICLLDEADSALDEMNVIRYANLLKSKSSVSQLIYITHNKNSMSVASHLIGVTMQKSGISQLVGVDIKALENMEAI